MPKSLRNQKLFEINLKYKNEITRHVKVRASTRKVAERRALKRNPEALGIARD